MNDIEKNGALGYRGLIGLLVFTVIGTVLVGLEVSEGASPPDPILMRVIMLLCGVLFSVLYFMLVRKYVIRNPFVKIVLIVLSYILFTTAAWGIGVLTGAIEIPADQNEVLPDEEDITAV